MQTRTLESRIGFCGALSFGQAATVFDDGYLGRLRNGDETTGAHFHQYFRQVLRRRLWGKFSREQEDELVDSSIVTAFQMIRKGQPREAARLPAYVIGICVNLTRLALRPSFNAPGLDLEQVHISDEAQSAEERLLQSERAAHVRNILKTLGERDRAILVDLFFQDMERDEVCEKHGVNREALRLILFRARKRFQIHWTEARNVR